MKNNKTKKIGIGTYISRFKGPVFFYILLSIVACACDIFFTITLAQVVELITVPAFAKAMIMLLVAIGINIFQRVCWYTCSMIYFKYSNKFMSQLSLDLAKQAFKLNSKTYNDHDTGTFVQRIVEDPAQIIDSLSNLVDMIIELISSIVMFIYIMTLNVYVSLIFIGLAVIAGVVEFYRAKIRRKNKFVVRRKNDKVHSLTTEIVRSEKDIKSLGLETKLSEVSKENYEDFRNHRYKMDKTDLSFWSLRNFIVSVGALAALMLGIYLMERALLTLAAFMIVYANRDTLWRLVFNAGNLSNTITNIKVCHSRMFALYDENEFVTERFGTETILNPVGEIEFKNVSYTFKEFNYHNSSGIENPKEFKKYLKEKKKNPQGKELVSENKIFDDLSFKITPNTTVAFVGKSGSGKSTILNLMSKMYEADDGQVLIDGHDIKTLNKETLRQTISLVNQFPYIFDMTIKENLILAKPDATDEEIKDAINKASLSQFVSSLPNGVDTKVGESGIKLSGGQKQRLAIARALLRNSNIIIFDESTSSLDNFAQEEVKKSIDALKGKSTIVIVAHRLSTIKNVDKIFFLEQGKIVDEGTFNELFERNENFKSMFLIENIG